MVPDIMHDILEGCAPYETKEMLKLMIAKSYFTLEALNTQIEMFPFTECDIKARPSIIHSSTLYSNDHKLNQKGNLQCPKLLMMFFV